MIFLGITYQCFQDGKAFLRTEKAGDGKQIIPELIRSRIHHHRIRPCHDPQHITKRIPLQFAFQQIHILRIHTCDIDIADLLLDMLRRGKLTDCGDCITDLCRKFRCSRNSIHTGIQVIEIITFRKQDRSQVHTVQDHIDHGIVPHLCLHHIYCQVDTGMKRIQFYPGRFKDTDIGFDKLLLRHLRDHQLRTFLFGDRIPAQDRLGESCGVLLIHFIIDILRGFVALHEGHLYPSSHQMRAVDHQINCLFLYRMLTPRLSNRILQSRFIDHGTVKQCPVRNLIRIERLDLYFLSRFFSQHHLYAAVGQKDIYLHIRYLR